MSYKIKSYLNIGPEILEVDIYGVSSRSIPGLEIIGLGTKGRLIREKLNFLTKRYCLNKRTIKRHVISIEANFSENKLKDRSPELEFPILILYWVMSGFLPIRNLDNCWANGSVSVDLGIRSSFFKNFFQLPEGAIDKTMICIDPPSNTKIKNYILWKDLRDHNG